MLGHTRPVLCHTKTVMSTGTVIHSNYILKVQLKSLFCQDDAHFSNRKTDQEIATVQVLKFECFGVCIARKNKIIGPVRVQYNDSKTVSEIYCILSTYRSEG